MRVSPTVCLLSLLFAFGAADAQSVAPAPSAAPSPSAAPAPPAAPAPSAAPSESASPKAANAVAHEPVKSLKEQTDAWFKDCKQGWDASTHMSRRDYERTCLRMAQERIKFMRDWEKTGGDRPKAR